jgi:hypothetical protein
MEPNNTYLGRVEEMTVKINRNLESWNDKATFCQLNKASYKIALNNKSKTVFDLKKEDQLSSSLIKYFLAQNTLQTLKIADLKNKAENYISKILQVFPHCNSIVISIDHSVTIKTMIGIARYASKFGIKIDVDEAVPKAIIFKSIVDHYQRISDRNVLSVVTKKRRKDILTIEVPADANKRMRFFYEEAHKLMTSGEADFSNNDHSSSGDPEIPQAIQTFVGKESSSQYDKMCFPKASYNNTITSNNKLIVEENVTDFA